MTMCELWLHSSSSRWLHVTQLGTDPCFHSMPCIMDTLGAERASASTPLHGQNSLLSSQTCTPSCSISMVQALAGPLLHPRILPARKTGRNSAQLTPLHSCGASSHAF